MSKYNLVLLNFYGSRRTHRNNVRSKRGNTTGWKRKGLFNMYFKHFSTRVPTAPEHGKQKHNITSNIQERKATAKMALFSFV